MSAANANNMPTPTENDNTTCATGAAEASISDGDERAKKAVQFGEVISHAAAPAPSEPESAQSYLPEQSSSASQGEEAPAIDVPAETDGEQSTKGDQTTQTHDNTAPTDTRSWIGQVYDWADINKSTMIALTAGLTAATAAGAAYHYGYRAAPPDLPTSIALGSEVSALRSSSPSGWLSRAWSTKSNLGGFNSTVGAIKGRFDGAASMAGTLVPKIWNAGYTAGSTFQGMDDVLTQRAAKVEEAGTTMASAAG